jgi:hypothetical protein
MEQIPRQSRIRIWLGRLSWLAGGALLVFAGFWIVPSCVTHRIELVNLETVPADVELFFIKGRQDAPGEFLWRGRIESVGTTELAFDFGRAVGHYRLRGRHEGTDTPWDRRFGYVRSLNYDEIADIALIGINEFKLKGRYPKSMQCPRDDWWCIIPEITVLAMRASRCMVKGQEAWWRG